MRPHFPLAKAMLWPGAPQSVQTVTGFGSFMRWYGHSTTLWSPLLCERVQLRQLLPVTGSPVLAIPKVRMLFTRILLIPSTSDSSRHAFAAL